MPSLNQRFLHRLSDAYELWTFTHQHKLWTFTNQIAVALNIHKSNSRRLTDACGHICKKKCILLIFGKFNKINPCAVGSNRRILDRNVVVLNDHELDSNHRPLIVTLNFLMHRDPIEDNSHSQKNLFFDRIKINLFSKWIKN